MKIALSVFHSLSFYTFPHPLFQQGELNGAFVVYFSVSIDILYIPSIAQTLTYIFSRYGISGKVDGLKCSSRFLKDVSSPLALQTSKA